MPILLVVDDSEVDREIIGHVLSQDLEWVVDFAETGAKALETMEYTLPDLVITDMMMPEINGLELVSKVRTTYPQLPVILITGQGSETLAAEALKKGAASYVPKSQLNSKLMETVKEVLAVANIEQSRDRLLDCITATQSVFKLDNDPALIPRLVELIQQTTANMKLFNETETRHLGVAATEALYNAMLHGNLELPPVEARQARSAVLKGEASPLIEQRQAEAPYNDRKVAVRIHFTVKDVHLVVRDEGPGFNVKKIQATADADAIDQAAGRGFVLMRSFMDEVIYNDTGNEVKLIMARRSSSS